MYPIADLHCDLLGYLADSAERTPENSEVRCSLPQLKAGNVHLQTLAVYTETAPGSTEKAAKELMWFQKLCQSGKCTPLTKWEMPERKGLHAVLSIENASGLCEEEESLEKAFARLDSFCTNGPLLYVSLTWHFENRFGGGNMTQIGLKRDGELLLECLGEKNISIDLSHTSDALAYDILNYIDKKALPIIPIASHSNFRKVVHESRNLPDELVLEIVKRGGVIGINLVKDFIGPNVLAQLEHALQLGIFQHISMGADFFYEGNIPPEYSQCLPMFHREFSDSSCYPRLFKLFHSLLTPEQLHDLAWRNLARYMERRRGCFTRS